MNFLKKIFLSYGLPALFSIIAVNNAFAWQNKSTQTKAVYNTIAVTIDIENEKQTIENFGASDCWSTKFIGKWDNQEKKNLVADYLFSMDTNANGQPKGIGLSLWRFNIGSGSYEQGAASNIKDEYRREECFLNTDGTYDWTKQQGQQWFLDAAKKRGLNNFLAFSISPPVQFTQDGKAHGLGGANLNLKKGKEKEYASFMVNVVQHFNKAGYHMPYLSPFNEPQWNWGDKKPTQEGTAATNTEIADFTKILGSNLKGTKIKIVLGEAAQWNFLSSAYDNGRGNQIRDFFDRQSANYIGDVPNLAEVFSAHSYFTTCPDSVLIGRRADVIKAKNRYAPQLRFWQSEFGILGNICGQYNGSPRNTGIEYGLYVAKVIHHDLAVANVSAWQWWLAVSPYNYSDALVYINDLNGGYNLADIKTGGVVSDSKQLWCMGNYSRFVRPGMVRVAASCIPARSLKDAADTQMITAYKNEADKKMVLVIVNMEDHAKKLVLNLANKTSGEKKLITYTTSATQNLAKSQAWANNVVLPAKSVVTLVGDYQ